MTRPDISFAAHPVHTASGIARPSACTECHLAPIDVLSEGHIFDSTPERAEVAFGGGRSPEGTYDGTTCGTSYCHGDGRGASGVIAKDAAQRTCSDCHAIDGVGMSGEHAKHIADEDLQCRECHATVVDAALTVIGPSLHVDGAREVSFAQGGTYDAAIRRCSGLGGGCHDAESWND